MRRVIAWLASLLVVTGFSGIADAGGARIASGGPRSENARNGVLSQMDRLASTIAVCWVGKRRPKKVKISIDVASTGRVKRSSAKTKGAVAQCAAGVLAVRSMPKAKGGYSMVLEISTRTQSAVNSIADQLHVHRDSLHECYEREVRANGKLRGRVVLEFLVRPDGRISDARIGSTTLKSRKVESCLTNRLEKLRVGKRSGGKMLSMSLALDFDGPRVTGTNGRPTSVLQPQKVGPVPASEIQSVIKKRLTQFTACYDRVAKRKKSLAGSVVLRFTIRADGTVRNVKIRETKLNNAKVENCIVKVGQKLRFSDDKGRADTRVFYPFVFSSK